MFSFLKDLFKPLPSPQEEYWNYVEWQEQQTGCTMESGFTEPIHKPQAIPQKNNNE